MKRNGREKGDESKSFYLYLFIFELASGVPISRAIPSVCRVRAGFNGWRPQKKVTKRQATRHEEEKEAI